MEKIRGTLIAGAVAAGLGLSGSAMAASIGVNFVGGNNGGGASVTDVAGFVTQGNWNNESSNTGTDAAVKSDSGSAAGATLTWNSPNVWASGSAGQNQNGVLMQGYIDNSPGNNNTATLTSLPASIAGTGSTPYNVIVYIAGDTPGRGGDLTVNGVTQTLVSKGPSADGLFVLATPGPSGTGGTPGNYALFTGVTGTTLNISGAPTIGGTPRIPIDGFQVVSGTVPEPAALGLIGVAGVGLLGRRRRARQG